MNGSAADPAGRVALVTGGGTGIGRAAALALARAGASVGLIGRRPDPLQRVATAITSLGGEALAVPCDVTEDRQVAAAPAARTEDARLVRRDDSPGVADGKAALRAAKRQRMREGS